MALDIANGPFVLADSDAADRAANALRRLADATGRAEGAFGRLVARVATVASGIEAPLDLVPDAPDLPPGGDTATDLVEDAVAGNAVAADRSLEIWEAFGDRIVDTFAELFDQVAQDGEISLASVFKTVAPLVTDLFREIAGIDISGLAAGIGGIVDRVSSGRGIGLGDILTVGSSILDIVSGSGPLGGILGGGSGLLAAANPYLAAASAVAQVLGPVLFARSPSVGPTTVARVSPATRDAVYTTDNGGDPAALVATVETIFEEIDRFRSRFGGALNGNGFDIGYFPAPEDGSGQGGGYNFKAIIGAHAEDSDRFRGLSEADLITEAVRFIVQEVLEDMDVAEVAEAARHSVAGSLEELFDDLAFAERFGALRDALNQAGDGIDAYTVALQRQRREIEETGRSLAADGIGAIRDFLERVTTLFPADPAPHVAVPQETADVGAIGTPVPGTDSTLLFHQDEGVRSFQPGVGPVYDEREGTLIGLDVAGQTLRFDNSAYQDEGSVLRPEPAGEGTIVLTPEGATIANDALRDLVTGIDALAESAEAATGPSQDYLDNRDRVRDAFAIALADVDALIAAVAGAFEPEAVGPFEERLLAGTAALEAMEAELERINDDIAAATEAFPDLGVAAIDVAARVEEASGRLVQQLRADYGEEIADELREARGFGAENDLADLADAYEGRRDDGIAIGVTDFSDLEELFRLRIGALLEGTDDLAGLIDALGGSFTSLGPIGDMVQGVFAELGQDFTGDLDREVRESQGFGLIDEIADRLADHEDRRRLGAALGVTDLSGLDAVLREDLTALFDPSALTPALIDGLQTAFADNALVLEALTAALDVGLGAANDNAAAQLTLADATRLATQELASQIKEQESLAGIAERVVATISDTRRRIALDQSLSTLSPTEQLDEAWRFFEALARRSADGDQEAQLELGAAAEDYLQLARGFYASTEDYARIFDTVDAALGGTQSVAEQQLDVARAQLEELRAIARNLSGDVAGLPNPEADFGFAPTRNRIIARLTGYSGDFGGGGFSAFRAGLSDDLNRAVDLLEQTVPFAAGGIMTDRGPLPLSVYGGGGVADTPQLALFGEGRLPEAFVPLPDGRSIPVTIARPANDGGLGAGDDEGLTELIEEVRRMTASLAAMRTDNVALRRGLERVVAASRGAGRAA